MTLEQLAKSETELYSTVLDLQKKEQTEALNEKLKNCICFIQASSQTLLRPGERTRRSIETWTIYTMVRLYRTELLNRNRTT
jgi:hypothetical protein